MKILRINPGSAPEIQEIDLALAVMQEIVGGMIQALFPFDDPVALICNDEGKLLHLPANRALRDETGTIYDIVCGSFFLCGAPPDKDEFESQTAEQVEQYRETFRHPEIFLNVNGQIVVLPWDGR